MPDWKQCEGEFAGGEFRLERLLDGREASAVFLTWCGSGRAVIKLVLAGPEQGAELVERWNRAATLCHPHLVRILAAGTGEIEGAPLAYLVMEYAEENLAEVLRERPLTSDETRDMLLPVADALAYLHGQGLVHGNLKPSNIFAVEDTVKISSEEVAAGDPAADIRALGVALVQALTQNGQESAADALPFPFREIAQNSLRHDPGLRWSAARIGAWLRSPEPPAAPTAPPPAAPAPPPATPFPPPAAAPAPPPTALKPAARKPGFRYYIAAAVLVVGAAIVGVLAMHPTAAPVPPAASAVPPPDRPEEPPPAPPAAQDGITHREIPDIPAQARNTVQGVATVVVRVAVDPSGKVTEAAQEGAGSRYFGKLAVEAARRWQFAPVKRAGPRNWILRFEIMPTATQVIPLRADRE